MKSPSIKLPNSRPQTRGQRIFARAPGAGLRVPSAGTGTTLELYGGIGSDVTAAAFRRALPATGDVVVRINSIGGDVFESITIYNYLASFGGNVDVEVVGLAASGASIVAMAGN